MLLSCLKVPVKKFSGPNKVPWSVVWAWFTPVHWLLQHQALPLKYITKLLFCMSFFSSYFLFWAALLSPCFCISQRFVSLLSVVWSLCSQQLSSYLATHLLPSCCWNTATGSTVCLCVLLLLYHSTTLLLHHSTSLPPPSLLQFDDQAKLVYSRLTGPFRRNEESLGPG